MYIYILVLFFGIKLNAAAALIFSLPSHSFPIPFYLGYVVGESWAIQRSVVECWLNYKLIIKLRQNLALSWKNRVDNNAGINKKTIILLIYCLYKSIYVDKIPSLCVSCFFRIGCLFKRVELPQPPPTKRNSCLVMI